MNGVPSPKKAELQPPVNKQEGEPSREDYIEMRCYIRYNLYYGQGYHDIQQALLRAGWKKEEIEKAHRELKSIS
ncbi:hypothetical protein HY501_03255 [Candidatus Woesearchaeota archaeon]|nr:hypothetical protein [Candidatus Woesearchaeota archaeon]